MRLWLFIILALLSCSPDLSDDAIPPASFPEISINLSLPEFNLLKTKGYQNIDGGIRGIILYRKNANQYYAIERNCSYHPNEACATVEVHSSGLYIIDPCCNSNFDFEGNPTGGVAWRPLNKYATMLNGSTLTISDNTVQ